jgi:hypothetical protein
MAVGQCPPSPQRRTCVSALSLSAFPQADKLEDSFRIGLATGFDPLPAEAAVGHRRLRNLATSAFAASCAAVASLNFLTSAGLVLPRPIGSAALFKANALRSAAMAL